MPHFIDAYADQVNAFLHRLLGDTVFLKQEIIEVPGVVAGFIVTYDGIRDDSRETADRMTWEEFSNRMVSITPKWKGELNADLMQKMGAEQHKHKVMGGYERRTIYFLRGGSNPEQWTAGTATDDVAALYAASTSVWGPLIQQEAESLKTNVAIGREDFLKYERAVRVILNFLFLGELGEFQAQSRTAHENEGVEIRDLIATNKSNRGFWKDIKDKYSASEIVIDAKNTDHLTREDLRQLYCYLKPALGFLGFIVTRSRPSETISAFNRTLFKNFVQRRGVVVLCDDDLRRMIEIKNRGNDPSAYLQDRLAEFVRSV